MPHGRTAKGEAARARIIAETAGVIFEFGVMDTTLDDIRERTGTSKGQLFHYFPDGKDELLTAVADYEANHILNSMQARMQPLTSWSAWYRWRDQVIQQYDREGDECPLRVLVNQLAPTTPGSRAVVAELLSQWHSHIRHGIEQMQIDGEIRSDLTPERAASAVLTAVQGGVVMMAATDSVAHLASAIDVAIEYLGGSR